MRALLAIALVTFLGCGEEQGIIRVKPVISICPARGAAPAECDRAIELGDLPIEVAHSLELFVVNRGEGVLVVSSVGGVEVTSEIEVPFTVAAGGAVALPLRVTPSVLGEGAATLSIESDDRERSPHQLELRYFGTPAPSPSIELCAGEDCGTDVTLDFGLVRRTQRVSAVIQVRNAGDAPLAIRSLQIEGASSLEREIALLSATRAGRLEPGTAADVVVAYEPKDGVPDEIALLFASDDPDASEARATILGSSDANAPPVADAIEASTASTAARVTVETLVVVDGAASRDPEGDPLSFAWTLIAPERSRAELDDPTAGLVTFLPDVAGEYRVELVVTDSLMQASLPAAVVIVAEPRFAFRAILDWEGGGDVDLLLENESGGVCSFEDPRPAWGAELRNDAEVPPGGEEIVFETPAPGIYELWAYYYDDGGLGSAEATVQVIFDDASAPAFSATATLSETCALWHVGSFSHPPSQLGPSSDPLLLQCR